MQRLLLLVPTTSYRTEDFMAAAGRLGIELILGTNEEHALSEISDGGIQTFNFEKVEIGVQQILALAAEKPLDAILSVDDGANAVSAKAAEKLDLQHSGYAAVTSAKNKFKFRDAVARAGLPSPPYRLASIDDNPAAIARELEYPVVIKPLSLAMSRGVIRADGGNSFVAAFDQVKNIIAEPDAKSSGESAKYLLIEGYIEGTEYAVEGLVRNGTLHVLAIFDKPDPLDGPYFEETIYVAPADIDDNQRTLIRTGVQAALDTIKLDDGPVHVDLRINQHGVHVIEVDARSIGGRCGRSLRFADGLRLEDIILSHALGRPIEPKERLDRAGGVMMIPIPKTGILRNVEGLEKASRIPLVEEASVTIPIGDKVVTLPEGGRYLGFIIAQGPTAKEVTEALRTAHEYLQFTIE